MGTTSENLKPKTKRGERFLEKVCGIRKKKSSTKDDEDEEEPGQTFIDNFAAASESLDEMIETKEKDLASEGKDKREENSRKVEVLKTVRFHMSEVTELVLKYMDKN